MKSRLLIFVLVLGFIAIAAGWIYESQLSSRIKPAKLEIPDNIDYFLTNMNYRAIGASGQLDYEFSSPRLEHRPLNDVSLIEVPALNIYRESVHWRVNALMGELQHGPNLLWLRQQVVMQKIGETPFELQTESVRFDPENNLVSIDSSVLLKSPQTRTEADAAVFDLAGKIYRLTGPRTVYYHEDS